MESLEGKTVQEVIQGANCLFDLGDSKVMVDPGLEEWDGQGIPGWTPQCTDEVYVAQVFQHNGKMVTLSMDTKVKQMHYYKHIGNQAFNRGDYATAIQNYTRGLLAGNGTPDNKQDMAALLSNRSNCCMRLGRPEEALEDAEHSLRYGPMWWKGHWRIASAYKVLHKFQEAASAFGYGLQCVGDNDSNAEATRVKFLVEIVQLLQYPKSQEMAHEQLINASVDKQVWTKLVLEFSENSDWLAVYHLMLGGNKTEKPGFAGVATNNCDTQDVVLSNSLSRNASLGDKRVILMVVLIQHGADPTRVRTLHGNTPLHDGMEYCLNNASEDYLEFLFTKWYRSPAQRSIQNDHGDTVFHILTKNREVSVRLQDKMYHFLKGWGVNPCIKNNEGKRASDCIDPPSGLIELLEEYAESYDDEINNLEPPLVTDQFTISYKLKSQAEFKKLGNKNMNAGNYMLAYQNYTKALESGKGLPDSDHEISHILSNRSCVQLKLGRYQEALKDGKNCLRRNPEWSKGYWRYAKALVALNEHKQAVSAFDDGFNVVKNTDPRALDTRISFVLELVKLFEHPAAKELSLSKLENPKIDKQIWSKVVLDLAKHFKWQEVYQLMLGGSKNCVQGYGGLATGCHSLANLTINKDLSLNTDLQQAQVARLIIALVNHGANPTYVKSFNGATALHIGLEHSMNEGHPKLIEKLFKKWFKTSCQRNVQDDNGDTLYHQVINKRDLTGRLRYDYWMELLFDHGVDPGLKDCKGKRALDHLTPHSPCYSTLKEITDNYKGKILDTAGQAMRYMKTEEWSESLRLFARYIGESYKDRSKKDVVAQSQMNIVQILHNVNEISSKVVCKAPPQTWKDTIARCVSDGKWRQLYLLINGGGNSHVLGSGGLAKGCSLSDVCVTNFLSSGYAEITITKYDIVCLLLDNGAKPDGIGPMKAAEYAIRILEDARLVLLLLQYDAMPTSLSLDNGDTPLHAALMLSLKRKDDFTVLKYLFQLYQSDPRKYPYLHPCVQDAEGNTLFHLVIHGPPNAAIMAAVKLLAENKVDPQIRNKQGSIPLNSLKKNDRRLPYLKVAASHHPVTRSKKKLKEDERIKVLQSGASIDSKFLSEIRDAKKGAQLQKPSVLGMALREEIIKRITVLIDEMPEFVPKRPKLDSQDVIPSIKTEIKIKRKTPTVVLHDMTGPGYVPELKADKETKIVNQMIVDKEEEAEDKDDADEEGEFDASIFDDLVWEVECTSAVWKILRNKRLEQHTKVHIVDKIRLLANGMWSSDLCKRMEGISKQHDVKLFEARLNKAARILWELAIAFSPRCSEGPEKRLQMGNSEVSGDKSGAVGGRIYSEVIRVWDIVFDHDNVPRSIENIIKSHNRGQTCIIKKNLKGIDRKEFQKGRGTTDERVPMFFREATEDQDLVIERKKPLQQEEIPKLFFPPASSNETEYHIMKFYSFTSTLVNNILLNKDTKVDFPFRVTELEHAIIHLDPKPPSAILLLGRSGTGKTTCCLYRMWSSFLNYWEHAAHTGPWIPRDAAFVQDQRNATGEQIKADTDPETMDGDLESFKSSCSPGPPSLIRRGGNRDNNKDNTMMDHLHQIFITKNAVLCSEVQKNFRDLSHACDAAKEHVEVEDNEVPHRLQDAHPAQFPLFLNSTQWLLMLDASLPDPYFPRNPDGSLKREITGWGKDGAAAFIPMLEEEEEDDDDKEENDSDNDDGLGGDMDEQEAEQRNFDPRKEVTYDLFAQEIWPKINKSKLDYHPTLVWMEIISFIKGSVEALHTRHGFLSLQQYQELGRKRAPNFTADRQEIYKLFQKYLHVKSQHNLFDECDLVYSVSSRLKKVRVPDWVVHQFYIDETQDFTQAELSVIIRCCSNPNALFLTGDTAQSIMRGVAFRFDDLKTLFHFASKSMKAVGKTARVTVPKRVYQLTHNYRSHAGILNLATSVVDLMIEFFPESFDRLQKDQGLFDGPQPVILESCSFSDLALLLRGNKRRTSEIEFGAHQVILVANEEAKANLPEELSLGLVLTIYESKGLEFDDVLLYNFFKDSAANKEWRVVTAYLEKLIEDFQDSKGKSSKLSQNLVELDLNEHVSSTAKPRALQFDCDKHKVLNSELKYLYTALTRARVNVWIFDEDPEKRAPMFEYFRKRKLVNVISVAKNENGEGSLSDAMFASVSSVEEWNSRGDYFYNNKLWQVAAKCYKKGGDATKEKMSLAQYRALEAGRLRENPRKMREEFLKSADQFMLCDLPHEAARCLFNAKEYKLSAQLFEKLGKVTNAAILYEKRLKMPSAAARCYELSGCYWKSIELLSSINAYDKAADVVERYNIFKQDYQDRNLPIPAELQRNSPGVLHTIERLCFSSAEYYYHRRKYDQMLGVLSRLPEVDDQLDFLKERKLDAHAATILKENGRILEAAKLMRSRGKLKETLECVDATVDPRFRAEVLASYGRVNIESEESVQYLDEAIMLFRGLNDLHGEAEATYTVAHIKKNKAILKEAYHLYFKANNSIGQIECTNKLLKFEPPTTSRDIRSNVLPRLDQLFKLISYLDNPIGPVQNHNADLCYTFYGLKDETNYMKEILVHEGARFLKISGDMRGSLEVSASQARKKIMMHLFKMGLEWIKSSKQLLQNEQTKLQQCQDYIMGFQCRSTNTCPHLHVPYSRHDYHSYLNSVTAEIMLHDLLMKASHGRKHHTKSMVAFDDLTKESERLCLLLHEALLPKHSHLKVCSDNPLAMNQVLQIVRRPAVVNQLRVLAEHKWKSASLINQRSNTDMYFLIWMLHLLALEEHHVFQEWLINMQAEYGVEVKEKRLANPERIPLHIGLWSEKSKNKVEFFSMMHTFFESVRCMYEWNDPVQSVGIFNRFLGLPAKRAVDPLIPSITNAVMFLELKYTVCLAVYARCNNISVIVPANYLAQINFFDALLGTGRGKYGTYVSVNNYQFKPDSIKLLSGQIRFMVKLMCGELSKHFNILGDAFYLETDEYIKSGEAERALILALVMLVNIEYVTPIDCELMLRKQLMNIELSSRLPYRLSDAINAIHRAEGISDIVVILKTLLRRREDEYLYSCTWRWDPWMQGLYHENLSEKKTFRRFKTTIATEIPPEMDSANVMRELEDFPVKPDEIARVRQEQAYHDRQRRMQIQAKNIIVRYYRAHRLRCSLKALVCNGRHSLREIQDYSHAPEPVIQVKDPLEQYTLTDTMCGVCGVVFAVSDGRSIEDNKYDEVKFDDDEGDKKNEVSERSPSPTTVAADGSSRKSTTLTSIGEQLLMTAGDAKPTTPLPSSSSSNPMNGPGGDLKDRDSHTHEKDTSPTHRVHVHNLQHIQKTSDFNTYKKSYMTRVLPVITDCDGFYQDMDQQSDLFGSQTQLALDIQKLKGAKTKLDEIVREVHHQRSWERIGDVVEPADDLCTILNQVKKLIKEIRQEEDSKFSLATGGAGLVAADGGGIDEEDVVLATAGEDEQDLPGHLLKVSEQFKKKQPKQKGGRAKGKRRKK